MVLNLKAIMLLALHLLPGVKNSVINLSNNGHDGIVIAINPSVPEDEKLIQNIKADGIVANPYLKYGDDPYTLQYGQCGEKGQYIHFTPNFLLANSRAFAHEWAHLRWGIFDEYNVDGPFYVSRRNTIEATRCSTHITGNMVFKECQGGSCVTRPCRRDSQTGLYEAKCTFIPEKSQTARESIMFMQSLNSVTVFCTAETYNPEAPNLQNKMFNHRSTWDVIMDSECIVNDGNRCTTSSYSFIAQVQTVSSRLEDRLFQMNQATELHLIQIIEKGSLVGMVIFESFAKIQNYLTKITDDQKITANVPQVAGGGPSVCSGLREGFQVIIHSNQSTAGSEIILLTDGEDDQISSCFVEVKESGAVIHTIALGPSAAKELETLSNMTGHRFYANKDINCLIDAFSRISSRSGHTTSRLFRSLESKAWNIAGRKQISGTVVVDSTIVNDTFLVVTWTTQKPEILQDPKGKTYKTSDFIEDKLNIWSAHLRIPDRYLDLQLLDKHASSQMLTVTMTTRTRSPTMLPIIATTHMSQNTAHYPSPVIVYAQVSQGFLPVLEINVTAIIETEGGHQVTLELWDSDAGSADTVKNDGIYSRYFTDYRGNGRYSLKVHAQAKKNMARLILKQRQNKALYIPGYVENGKSEVKDDMAEAKVEDCSKLQEGHLLYQELLLLVIKLMCSHLVKLQTLRLSLKIIILNFHGRPLAMYLIKE
ncbi:hypothetical protein MC885_001141, partial [Smutsia gigantea]